MGLSASEARFLMLTAQRSDLEYEAQQISYKRTILATKSDSVHEEYNEKTSNMLFAYIPFGQDSYVNFSYEAFESDANFSNMYLTDTAQNKVVADKKYIPEGEDPDDYTIDSDLLKSDYLEKCLREGIYYITQDGEVKGEIKQKTIAEIPMIHEIYDTSDDAAAEAKYDKDMAKLEKEDKQLEMELNRVETQHKAIEVELESIQKVIDKNIESTFKTFS